MQPAARPLPDRLRARIAQSLARRIGDAPRVGRLNRSRRSSSGLEPWRVRAALAAVDA